MFEVPKPRKSRARASLLCSFAFHCLLVFLWLSRPPIFVQPSSVAWGLRGTSDSIVYFATAVTRSEKQSKKLQYHSKPKPKAKSEPPQTSEETARAGMADGSMFNGPATGTEATPALPLVFPDPEIYPWQLKGVQGDVIVEVTIDEKGNVTNTRVLQSLQQDVDEKVIATLRNWRFRPALVDGIAISSRQDVHFHFPS